MENQLELFRTLLNGLDGYEKLSSALLAGRCPVLATGLNVIHKCHIAAALWQDSGRGMVIVTSDEPSANRMAEDINSFTGREAALLYPYRDFTFRQVDGVSREYEHARLKVLEGMSQGGCPIVVASAQAALQYTIPAPADRGTEGYEQPSGLSLLFRIRARRTGGGGVPVLPAGRHPGRVPASGGKSGAH